MAQTITKKPGEDILIVDEVVIPPDPIPPTGNCECDVKAGTTSTLAPGSQATAAIRKVDKTHFLDLGIPQGIPGPPSTGGGGSISLGKGTVDIRAYTVGSGSDDDAVHFERAWNAIRGTGGRIIVNHPDNFFNFKSTFDAVPDGSKQAWVDIICPNKSFGGNPTIRYTGPSNQPAIKIMGLKGGRWEGVHMIAEGGRENVQLIDILAPEAVESTSFVTFTNFYLNLGNGKNNVGVRTGYDTPKDISNYVFENFAVYGGGGFRGASIAGQYGFLNCGINTLSMAWKAGFCAMLDRIYSNVSQDRTRRGNGSVAFRDLGGAHNNIDFEIGWEQAYLISGGRFENGKMHMIVSEGGYSSLKVEDVVIHDYVNVNGSVIDLQRNCNLSLDNVQITNTNSPGKYAHPIRLSANNGFSALSIKSGGVLSDNPKPYTKFGNSQWDINIQGVAKMGLAPGGTGNGNVWSTGFFENENRRG